VRQTSKQKALKHGRSTNLQLKVLVNTSTFKAADESCLPVHVAACSKTTSKYDIFLLPYLLQPTLSYVMFRIKKIHATLLPAAQTSPHCFGALVYKALQEKR
jgi:hypothetical protein